MAGKGKDEFEAKLNSSLKRLQSKHLYRELKVTDQLIDFASNDYLSLNNSGQMDSLFRKTLEKTHRLKGSTGSRLIRGHSESCSRVEEKFTGYCGAEASLLFSSGYAANTGVLPAILGPRDEVFCDRLCHASLLDGVRLSSANRTYFAHNDLEDLRSKMSKSEAKGKWVLVESIYSMDGDSPDIEKLYSIAEEFDANVYIDEAHAIGIAGSNGKGLSHSINWSRKAIVVYPLGKAPGLSGCFVAGSRSLKEYLIQKARSFVFSTALPPIIPAVIEEVLHYLESSEAAQKRKQLKTLIQETTKLLQMKRIPIPETVRSEMSPIIPVIIGDANRTMLLSQKLAAKGYDVRGIRPPTVPEGTSRLRFNLHADDSLEDIQECLNLIANELQL